MNVRLHLLLVALFTLMIVAEAARAGEIAEGFTTLERGWTDTCHTQPDPVACVSAARKGVDRLRTLLPGADRHEALQGLVKYAMLRCATLVQENPNMLRGIPVPLFLAECTVQGYRKTIEQAGGVLQFIEAYMEATATPELQVREGGRGDDTSHR